MIPALEPVLRRRDGVLTEELVREPGAFGLGQVPSRLVPDATTTMVCGFCSTGCGLNVHLKDGVAINLSADPAYPVNLGMACPKGWEALAPLEAPDRGTTPLLRRADGVMEPVSWAHAMAEFCGRLKAIRAAHGPESVAFLSTGQIPTEEMALLGCLFKFGMGFVHCDSNTRQCMATANVAYKQSFGFDAPPFSYADLEESDVLVFIGANPCIAHPILWQRVMRNPHRPEIVVLDPRRTETAMAATQHYALRPKSDLTVLYGLARLLLQLQAVRGDFIAAHTVGFAGFAAFVQEFPLERVVRESGLPAEQLWRLAGTIAEGKRVSFWWTMGVNQSHESTRTAQAIINLALMTGNIGRPGTGANSITGQCNAMGSRLFSNISGLIGGHDAENPRDRAKVASILGLREELIPRQPAMAYDEILDAIDDGRIHGLWVIATNAAHSWVQQARCERILAKLDFLVVQDMYPTTATAGRANLFLPAAGWGEKDGTFINSERRIGLVKKVRRAPGQALADFHIFRLVAHTWGCAEMFARWKTPEDVFAVLRELSEGQPCDFSGITDYRMIDAHGGIQWPLRPGDVGELAADRPREARLFADGKFFTADHRARFLYGEPQLAPDHPDAEYPLVLLTGRESSAQWHTNTRTGKSDMLRRLAPEDWRLDLHPDDAEAAGVRTGDWLVVRSRWGSLEVAARVTPLVGRGQAFLPMHHPGTNRLTAPVFDPHSRQPSYKACAVNIRRRE